MTDTSDILLQRIFAKTSAGTQEIAARALGLSPLLRRLLILLDGKRSLAEVATLVPGHDVAVLVEQLVAHGCVVYTSDATSVITVATAQTGIPAQTAIAPMGLSPLALAQLAFDTLPPASGRSAKDVQMARTFMTNTINTLFEQYSKLTLIEAIFNCKSAEDLRRVYPDWAQTMQTNTIAARRFLELSRQLFTTL